MSKLDELIQAAAGLPDADLDTLVGLANRLRVTVVPAGPDLEAIMAAAPEDDEPWTADDEAASIEALADLKAGRVHAVEDVRRMLGA